MAAASKSAAAPPANIKEQLAGKKPPADNRVMNDAGTHLKRLSSGELKGDQELKQDANAALSIFKSLADKKQKVEFSKKNWKTAKASNGSQRGSSSMKRRQPQSRSWSQVT